MAFNSLISEVGRKEPSTGGTEYELRTALVLRKSTAVALVATEQGLFLSLRIGYASIGFTPKPPCCASREMMSQSINRYARGFSGSSLTGACNQKSTVISYSGLPINALATVLRHDSARVYIETPPIRPSCNQPRTVANILRNFRN